MCRMKIGFSPLILALLATPAFGVGVAPVRLQPGPTLSLPWAEHGRLSQVTGRAPLGWSQEAYVIPQRPGKNLVRDFDHTWRSSADQHADGSAGLRHYR